MDQIPEAERQLEERDRPRPLVGAVEDRVLGTELIEILVGGESPAVAFCSLVVARDEDGLAKLAPRRRLSRTRSATDLTGNR